MFRCYFQTYEDHLGRPHPPIRAAQIARIMEIMPWIELEDRGGELEEPDVDTYRAIIAKHFATRYRQCDYNINHFFSGRIRELRFYEEVL